MLAGDAVRSSALRSLERVGLTGLVLVGLPVAAQQAPTGGASETAIAAARLAALEQRLQARDGLIESLTLAFRTHAASAQPPAAKLAVREAGLYHWQTDLEAIATLAGPIDTAPTAYREVWDHARCHSFSSPTTWSAAAQSLGGSWPPPVALTLRAERAGGQLGDWSNPGNLGLLFVGQPWSKYLERLSQRRVLRSDVVAGRPCAVVVGDMDNRAGDERFEFPWVIAFGEDETLLALRVESYNLGQGLVAAQIQQRHDSGQYLELDGQRWYRNACFEVDAVRRLAEGVWIGSRATFGYDEKPTLTRKLELDPVLARVNATPPAWLIDRAVADGVQVHDRNTGEVYYHGHAGDAAYEAQRRFAEILRAADEPAEARWSSAGAARDDVRSATDEALSLYAFCWLGGAPVALDALRAELESLPPSGAASAELGALEAAFDSLLLPLARHALASIDVADAHWRIGRVRPNAGVSPTCVVFRRVDESTARIVHPRRGLRDASWAELCARLEPEGLALAAAMPTVAAFAGADLAAAGLDQTATVRVAREFVPGAVSAATDVGHRSTRSALWIVGAASLLLAAIGWRRTSGRRRG
jgi:hypothetical protein